MRLMRAIITKLRAGKIQLRWKPYQQQDLYEHHYGSICLGFVSYLSLFQLQGLMRDKKVRERGGESPVLVDFLLK